MPRLALTESEITDFRERLCAVATALFARQGFDAVTLRAIAHELGCSPTTPYRYFASKTDIFNLVRAAAFTRFADALTTALTGIEDIVERLHVLIAAYVRFAVHNPDAYRLMFALRQGEKTESSELVRQMERSFECCRREVRAAIRAGVITGDVDTVAHLFWAGAHGIVSLHLADQLIMGRTVDELIEPMRRTLFLGNTPRHASGGKA